MPDLLKILLSLADDSGRIALKLMGHSRPELKPDASVITDADRAISALAHKRLAGLLATGEHILIDEEDPRRGEYLDEALLQRTPYVWAIDPIDGTRTYANRMPYYGISIGLIKDRRPFLGAVYFPTLKELFYCDGRQAYYVRDPFGPGARRSLIKPVDEQISSRSIMILPDGFERSFTWDSTDCHYMVLATAVTEFCWPCIGRGCGSLSRTFLWDLAGAWPIVEKAGLKFRSYKTGQPLERLDPSLFLHEQNSWRFRESLILSSERNFPLLRRRLIPKEA